jgi:DNA-binding NarL/FixJ family response regulator
MNTAATPKIRLLLVEDDDRILKATIAWLGLLDGIEVSAIAKNGEAAISQSHAVQPDVILMDIRMPILNGIDAAKVILQLHPNIKILFMSSFPNDDHRSLMSQIEGSRLLPKALPIEELQSEIQSVIYPAVKR